jgi:hypothetical protein
MQVEVTFLTRRGADAIMRKSQTVTADVVRFGRGTDNEVQLSDIRVELSALALRAERRSTRRRPRAADKTLFIQQSGDTPVRVNGASERNANVGPDDEISLGPYKIVVAKPPRGFDAAITIELVQPVGDSLDRLMAQSRIGLDKAGLSRRRYSWGFFLIFAILGIVIPIAVFPLGSRVSAPKPTPAQTAGNPYTYVNMSWNAGELSNPHRFFAENCVTCHRSAFARVPDAACATCHSDIGSHFNMSTAELGPVGADLDAVRCGTCHEEHRGVRGLVIRLSSLCTDCHSSLAKSVPKAGVRDVTGYPAGHPQFRATVVADSAKPTFVRQQIGGDPKPQDHSGLVFSHSAHLIETGFLTPSGRKIMKCADCHVPEPSGQGFMPLSFEGQCHSCHDLKFDAELPWREVPHGDVQTVNGAVRDFYAHMALQGGVIDPDAPPLARRPVGTPIEQATEAERRDALAWASMRSNAAMGIIFDEKRGCAYCHVVGRGGVSFTVAPVVMRQRFLPEARFDHARHAAMKCADCHDSRTSEHSSDVLIPGIETCVTCHGTEQATLKTQSTCTTCHVFHRQEFGAMKQAAAAAK